MVRIACLIAELFVTFFSLEPKRKPKDEFLFCIISKGRPNNVEAMMDLFGAAGIEPTWIVGKGEVSLSFYQFHTLEHFVISLKTL